MKGLYGIFVAGNSCVEGGGYVSPHFLKYAQIRGTFYDAQHNMRSADLAYIGWAEMIQNVVTIQLVYTKA